MASNAPAPDRAPPNTSREPRRSRSRAEATRERLLQSANALFAEKGYEGTSIGDVARQAGVGVGTVYHHFTDKRALLLALLYRNDGTRLDDESGGPHAIAFQAADVRSAVKAIVRLIVQLRRDNPAVYPIALDLARRNADVARACDRIETRHRAQLRLDIETGQKLGKVRPDIDPDAGARLLNHFFHAATSRVAEEPVGELSERLVREYADIICGYLLVS